MKLILKMIQPILWFALSVSFNLMLIFEFKSPSTLLVIILTVLSALIAAGAGAYALLILMEE